LRKEDSCFGMAMPLNAIDFYKIFLNIIKGK